MFPSGVLFLSSSFNLLNQKEKNLPSALGTYAFLFSSDFLLQQTFILKHSVNIPFYWLTIMINTSLNTKRWFSNFETLCLSRAFIFSRNSCFEDSSFIGNVPDVQI